MPLTGKQARHLRGLGHHLSPVVQVGVHGVTDTVVQAVDQALTDHELIKVRVGENAPEDRKEVGARLAEATRSDLAQVLGRTLLLFRPHPDQPKIKLPRAEPDEG